MREEPEVTQEPEVRGMRKTGFQGRELWEQKPGVSQESLESGGAFGKAGTLTGREEASNTEVESRLERQEVKPVGAVFRTPALFDSNGRLLKALKPERRGWTI